MSWFARIEQACAAFIERAFAKTFPSDLEPAQIARKLVATMEAQARGVEGAQIAPSRYVVCVSPEDFERLAPHQAYLESQWCALLTDMAARVNLRMAERVGVSMEPREGVPPGAVEIESVERDRTESIDVRPVTSPGSSQRFRLRMVRGVPAYGVYPLDAVTQVGRSEDSDVFLIDPSVSRQHAVIDLDAGCPIVRDLGSTNGTFVNGERIETRRLAAGDVVTFGKTNLRVEVGG